MSRARGALVALVALVARVALVGVTLLLGSPRAEAAPTRWTRAREPAIDRVESLLADVEALELRARHQRDKNPDDENAALIAPMYLQRARDLLEESVARGSRDVRIRTRLAELYHELQDDAKAAPLFEALLREDLTPLARGEIYGQLAISYARLGRHEDEIKAYGGALPLEPNSASRSRLLANRAEAYMAMGDIIRAVEGYRAALSMLSSLEMLVGFGATTFWGLAVALDRSGDLDSGLAAIELARSYDPLDKQISGPGWFYVPPYDKHYYDALGHWSAARRADLGAAQAEEYGQAIAAWEAYVERAEPDDKWLLIARVRLAQCQKEKKDRLARARGARGGQGAHGKAAPPAQRSPGLARPHR